MRSSYLVFLLLCIIGCEQSSSDRRLDYFGEFNNTPVTFTFSGITDSIEFGVGYFQYLHPRYVLDTTIYSDTGHSVFTKLLSLEKPTVVRLSIDGQLHEIFLLPRDSVHLNILGDTSISKVSFQDDELRRINAYFQQKSKLTNGLHRSSFYGAEMLKTAIPLAQIFVNMDSIRHLLEANLSKMTMDLDLPKWFVNYEEKSIYYRDLNARLSAPLIRQRMGIVDEALVQPFEFGQAGVLQDEEGLLSEDFLDLISLFMREEYGLESYFDLSENQKLAFQLGWLSKVPSQKIQDVYKAHKFLMMQLTAYAYEDSLVQQLRQSIGPDLQPYLSQLETNLSQLEGKKAPTFHLKNTNDELVTLSDYQGNIILLDFWFIGCPGCKEQLPFDRALLSAFADKPFKIIKVCMKSDKGQWLAMQKDLPGINLFSNVGWDKKLTRSYKIAAYPRYVLIDQEGVVIKGWSEKPSNPRLKERLAIYLP